MKLSAVWSDDDSGVNHGRPLHNARVNRVAQGSVGIISGVTYIAYRRESDCSIAWPFATPSMARKALVSCRVVKK